MLGLDIYADDPVQPEAALGLSQVTVRMQVEIV